MTETSKNVTGILGLIENEVFYRRDRNGLILVDDQDVEDLIQDIALDYLQKHANGKTAVKTSTRLDPVTVVVKRLTSDAIFEYHRTGKSRTCLCSGRRNYTRKISRNELWK